MATGPRSAQRQRNLALVTALILNLEILRDPSIHAVVIATPPPACCSGGSGDERGQAVFCENRFWSQRRGTGTNCPHSCRRRSRRSWLASIADSRPWRFSLSSLFSDINEPLAIQYRVNAGFIPADHWVYDLEQGGGRILGEVCHFVDFLCYLAGSCAVEVQCRSLGESGAVQQRQPSRIPEVRERNAGHDYLFS